MAAEKGFISKSTLKGFADEARRLAETTGGLTAAQALNLLKTVKAGTTDVQSGTVLLGTTSNTFNIGTPLKECKNYLFVLSLIDTSAVLNLCGYCLCVDGAKTSAIVGNAFRSTPRDINNTHDWDIDHATGNITIPGYENDIPDYPLHLAGGHVYDWAYIAADDVWDSRDDIDKFCPPLAAEGPVVECYPVAGYPLNIISQIDMVQSGDGEPSTDNIRPIKEYEHITVLKTGRNLFSFPESTKTVNGFTFEMDSSGMITINGVNEGGGNTASIYAFDAPLPAGVWYTVETNHSGPFGSAQSGNSIYFRTGCPHGTLHDFDMSAAVCGGSRKAEHPITYVEIFIGYNVKRVDNFTIRPMITNGIMYYEWELGRDGGLRRYFNKRVYGGSYEWPTGILTETYAGMTFDGTEDWKQISSTPNDPVNYYYVVIGEVGTIINNEAVCSHYPQKTITASTTHIGMNALNSTSSGTARLVFRPDLTQYGTIAAWKKYLAEQAAAGTPVQAVYKPSTPKTTKYTESRFLAFDGLNIIRGSSGDISVTGWLDPLHRIAELEAQTADEE